MSIRKDKTIKSYKKELKTRKKVNRRLKRQGIPGVDTSEIKGTIKAAKRTKRKLTSNLRNQNREAKSVRRVEKRSIRESGKEYRKTARKGRRTARRALK